MSAIINIYILYVCRVFSEFQRAYGVGDEPTSKMEGLNDGKNSVITNMKLMEKESHVFRTGDYDNIGKPLINLVIDQESIMLHYKTPC